MLQAIWVSKLIWLAAARSAGNINSLVSGVTIYSRLISIDSGCFAYIMISKSYVKMHISKSSILCNSSYILLLYSSLRRSIPFRPPGLSLDPAPHPPCPPSQTASQPILAFQHARCPPYQAPSVSTLLPSLSTSATTVPPRWEAPRGPGPPVLAPLRRLCVWGGDPWWTDNPPPQHPPQRYPM